MHRPAARLAAVGRDLPGRAGMSRVGLTTIAVAGMAGIAVAIGRSLDLPGAQIVGVVAAAALVAASVVTVILRRHQDTVLRYALATGVAGALMWVAVGQSEVCSVYHVYVGTDLQRRGDLAGADDAFERARRYAPGDKAIERYERRLRRHVDPSEE